jgi:hypothetical protein
MSSRGGGHKVEELKKSLIAAGIGIANLKYNYANDVLLCCKFDLLISNIQSAVEHNEL